MASRTKKPKKQQPRLYPPRPELTDLDQERYLASLMPPESVMYSTEYEPMNIVPGDTEQGRIIVIARYYERVYDRGEFIGWIKNGEFLPLPSEPDEDGRWELGTEPADKWDELTGTDMYTDEVTNG